MNSIARIGEGFKEPLVIRGAILAGESLAPSLLVASLPSDQVGACQDWQLTRGEKERGIILEFWTPPLPLSLSFAALPAMLARLSNPPRYLLRRRTNAQRSGAFTYGVFIRMKLGYPTKQSHATSTKIEGKPCLRMCVCIRMHATASLFPLPSFPFAHFTPRWPPPPSSSSTSTAAAQDGETSGANANETDLICAIICMTHIEEQAERGKKAAALGFGV